MDPMSAEYEKQLEAAIMRELKGLPDLPAPRTLMTRVLTAIENQSRLPWYRQSWQTWPVIGRAVGIIVLVAVFGGLCFAGWKLPQADRFVAASHMLGGWLAVVNVAWNAVSTVLGAVVLVVKHLGTGFIIACLVAAAFGYAMCVGLGTVYVRLAFARR